MILRFIRENRIIYSNFVLAGVAIVVVIAVAGTFAEIFAPHDPNVAVRENYLLPPAWFSTQEVYISEDGRLELIRGSVVEMVESVRGVPFDGSEVEEAVIERLLEAGYSPSTRSPSWSHPLGSDDEGRDILSGIMHSFRFPLLQGLLGFILASSLALLIVAKKSYRLIGAPLQISRGQLIISEVLVWVWCIALAAFLMAVVDSWLVLFSLFPAFSHIIALALEFFVNALNVGEVNRSVWTLSLLLPMAALFRFVGKSITNIWGSFWTTRRGISQDYLTDGTIIPSVISSLFLVVILSAFVILFYSMGGSFTNLRFTLFVGFFSGIPTFLISYLYLRRQRSDDPDNWSPRIAAKHLAVFAPIGFSVATLGSLFIESVILIAGLGPRTETRRLGEMMFDANQTLLTPSWFALTHASVLLLCLIAFLAITIRVQQRLQAQA